MTWPDQFQSADVIPALGCAVGAYAIGCFATGYYLVRARTGRDIREVDSGSIGARNVGRVLGRTGFWLTVFGDFVKGSSDFGWFRQNISRRRKSLPVNCSQNQTSWRASIQSNPKQVFRFTLGQEPG